MQIKLTWINTRRRKIIAFIIDFWLSVLIYNYTYFSYFNSYPNQLVSISIGSFWVISSYILGRYSLIEKNSGTTLSSVSKNLNYLVIGDKPTKRKVDLAKNHGIKIITLNDLKNLLN